MALIVETGLIVAGANSYVSRADFIQYASEIGISVASTESTDAALIKATEFISGKESRMKGFRVERDQSLPFPRYGLTINGFAYYGDEIPDVVVKCQMMIALDIIAGLDPYNPSQNKVVSSEKVEGAVGVSYHVDVGQQKTIKSKYAPLMSTFLISSAGLVRA